MLESDQINSLLNDCNSVSGFDEDWLESQMEESMRRIY